MNGYLDPSKVCIACWYDPKHDGERPDNPEILVCDTPYEDDNFDHRGGHAMCANCYEGYRFDHGRRACPMCFKPWTTNIDTYPQRLQHRIQAQPILNVTADNIKRLFFNHPKDVDAALYLIDQIQPGFDFYLQHEGNSLFYYAIMQLNFDIFDALMRKAIQLNQTRLFCEANVCGPRSEHNGQSHTALQWACRFDWAAAISHLRIAGGADPNFYIGLCPALHVALQEQNTAAALALITGENGASVTLEDKFGLGPLFYFCPAILKNAKYELFTEFEDEEGEIDYILNTRGALQKVEEEVRMSLHILRTMCMKGADVNQFGPFPSWIPQRNNNVEFAERWKNSSTIVTPLFAILANQHDQWGWDKNSDYFAGYEDLQRECWDKLAGWMVEVTNIFAQHSCDIYGRIYGGETLLYWVQRWSTESKTMPCREAYAKLLRHLNWAMPLRHRLL